jgi:maltose alpha-D-glucosyltransferase/alpha-amylase
VEVQLAGRTERYQLPLGIAWDGDTNAALPQQLALARIRQTRRMGYLTDAFSLDALPLGLIRALKARAVVSVTEGEVRCIPTSYMDAIELPANPAIRRLSAEQSNSSLIVGDMVIMKIIRRVMQGINPEVEMVRFLTENGYANTPPLLGEISRVAADGSSHTMMVAQRFVHNQGDAWQWTLDFLSRLSETVGVGEKASASEDDAVANYAAFARAMGTRLAQLHEVLARPSEDEAFAPEPVDEAGAQEFTDRARTQLQAAYGVLSVTKAWPDDATKEMADFILANQAKLLALLTDLAKSSIDSLNTRIHGDFHLGQVLFASGDAFIIDFEGEPSKPLAERRAKSSPLRDVAGLLRSFQYAAAAARLSRATAAPAGAEAPLQRFVNEMSSQFLTAYRAAEAAAATRWVKDKKSEAALLDLFLLEKSAYEICYEAANRPAWIGIPLRGFAEIARRVLKTAPEIVNA